MVMVACDYREIPPHKLYYSIAGADDALLESVVFPQLTRDQYYYLSKVLTGTKLSLLQKACAEMAEKVRNAASAAAFPN